MCVYVCVRAPPGCSGDGGVQWGHSGPHSAKPQPGKADGEAATWSLGSCAGWVGGAVANSSEAGRAEMLTQKNVYFSKPWGRLLTVSQRAGALTEAPAVCLPHPRLLSWDPWDAPSTEGTDPSCFSGCFVFFHLGWSGIRVEQTPGTPPRPEFCRQPRCTR